MTPIAGRRRPPSHVVLGAVVLTAVVTAVAVPVAAVLLHAVRPDGGFGVDAFARILGSVRTWRVVGITVGQAVGSTAFTLVLGLPVAWVLARFSFRGRSALLVLVTVPFVLPSVVIGMAFASLMGARGIVDLRATWWPILAAHACFNLAVVVRSVTAAVASTPTSLESCARTLGCRPWQAFVRVVLPVISPAVVSAATIVFLFCLTSFGVIVILGGGTVTTIEVELWARATRQFDLSGAGVLALLQLAAVIAALLVQRRMSTDTAAGRAALGPARRRVESVQDRLGVAGATTVVLTASLLPVAALAVRSFTTSSGWSLQHWRNLGSVTAGTGLRVAPLDAVAMSLRTTATAAGIAVLTAVCVVRFLGARPGRIGEAAVLLPLGVSSTTLGLGLLLVAGRPPVDLRSAGWLVPAAQALVALPVVVRTLLPAHRGVPSELLDAAATLGAAPRRRWWSVEFPLLRPALGAATVLAVLMCLGEFGATVFIARTSAPTVPVAIERLMSRPGGAGFGQAMALSCLLTLICCALVVVLEVLNRRARWGASDQPLL